MTLYRATAEGQVEMTPEEEAEFEVSRVPKQPSKEELNVPILVQLAIIDMKSIRALREGDADRISEYEKQSTFLRAQLAI